MIVCVAVQVVYCITQGVVTAGLCAHPQQLGIMNFVPNLDNIENLSEKAMATHSSTLAWKIIWMEEPGRLQSMESLGVGHD